MSRWSWLAVLALLVGPAVLVLTLVKKRYGAFWIALVPPAAVAVVILSIASECHRFPGAIGRKGCGADPTTFVGWVTITVAVGVYVTITLYVLLAEPQPVTLAIQTPDPPSKPTIR